MADSSFLPSPFPLGKLVAILVVVAAVALAFAWTAGWLSPHRLTPVDLVTAVQPPTGPALGHRRNHAKGICFTGTFTANGAGAELSTAQIFERGEYPVVGRFNIAGGDPKTPDPMAQLHGMGLRLLTPKAQEWRMAMIDAPFFAAPTPQDFYTFLKAAGSKDPNDFKHYVQGHPEILTFIGWVKTHPRTEGWAEDRFNSLNSFVFTDASGKKQVVRWSFIPAAPVVALTQEQLAQAGPNYLEADITKRIAAGPQRWEMMVTIANPGM
jgi:catalase